MSMSTKQKPMRKLILLLLGVTLFAACHKTSEQDHPHREAAHEHDEALSVDTTIWAKGLELFVEYPAFVVGHRSRFAAHFTRLAGHEPVEKGSLTVSLIKGTKGIRHRVEKPSSPGIFTPALQPKEAGAHQLVFELQTADGKARIVAGKVIVYPDKQSAGQALDQRNSSEPEISFLKEQAWKIDFQTAEVKKDTVYGRIKLMGKWIAVPSNQRTLNAGSSGNVLFETPELLEGKKLRKGQVLMRISGEDLNVSSLESEIRKAKATFEQANSEYKRKKELHELKVVPEAEFEAVEKRYEVALANYQQLLKNYGDKGVAIRAPFDGYLKQVFIENGTFVNAGQALLKMGSNRTSRIEAALAPEKRELISQTEKIWIQEKGRMLPVKAKIVAVGRNVSEKKPLLPLYLEVQTSIEALEGSLVELQLAYTTTPTKLGLVIPKEALLEDFGTYKLIVQSGGEAFEMRIVEVGVFNGNRVAIKKGLRPGERIVVQGAYQVKMASMSGTVGHGHAH